MSQKHKLTLMERALKAQEVARKHKINYDEKSKIPVICPWCSATSNLFMIRRHMKESAKCKQMKEFTLLTVPEKEKTNAMVQLQLNKFVRGIYDKETDEVETIQR